ncbi:1-hydroxycarotenoid 3,4-desaturase CrtD [Mucilaginibacter sp. BT774]|uniref:1-hydroxycarotenoid 3,4-desaturase CrtD n=1 Tax=Mucilaginibacter sp. BT774 TaxID=3062276 RepID=UPI0026752D61|nr:1-hydroxycarotenoid 3,4-desaturase CrtD [Mucilaginibacter sp. BT774]MDO3625518.1 phytoene desaturase family protein [Mucilaginibacter sp. BT774]
MPAKKALIIGAGIAGIAAAIRLAVKGYAVEVFEANDYPGGKLAEIKQDAFRFDAGPSLLTMPQYVDELFQLAGKDPSRFFSYQKLDIICKYFYEDGSRMIAYADKEQFVNEVDKHTGEGKAMRWFINNSGKIYELTDHLFLQRSLDRLKTFFTRKALKSLLRFGQIDTFRTMHQANSRFFADQRLQQYADRYATYNGSNPYQAPATLNVIPHLEQHFGAYLPKGGMYKIVSCLVELAESLGVKFHYRSKVDEIILKDKKAIGIGVNGEVINGDLVVSNMDVWFTYYKLLNQYPEYQPKKILEQERSSSALIFYWGIKKQFGELDLHNIFFTSDYQAEFDHIWQKQTVYHDPTVYVNISSKLKTDDAPVSCENWFVMINVPANKGQDWNKLIQEARGNILRKLSRVLETDITELIVCESILDPRSIEARTLSYQGSIYGTSSNSRYAAFLRHANRSQKIKNLYFCGGSVHPGGGIPLCLLSAKIVSEMI